MQTNCRIKYYKRHAELHVASTTIYGTDPNYIPRPKDPWPVVDKVRSLSNSKARARRAVMDIALCNDFTHMFTLTFSAEHVDRYDRKETYKKVSNWLREAVREDDFMYVCVPELHEDGAIHLHGLCCLGDVGLVHAINPKFKKPLKDKAGREVYNIPSWRWGFSTCVPLDSGYEEAALYCCSYITASEEKIFGKWYLSSRSCKKKPEYFDFRHVDDSLVFEDEYAGEDGVNTVEPIEHVFIWFKKFSYDLQSFITLPFKTGGWLRLRGLGEYARC